MNQHGATRDSSSISRLYLAWILSSTNAREVYSLCCTVAWSRGQTPDAVVMKEVLRVCLCCRLQVFIPGQARAGGKWRISRVCELEDVAYGTAFSSILLHKYQLVNQRQWDVLSLVPLR